MADAQQAALEERDGSGQALAAREAGQVVDRFGDRGGGWPPGGRVLGQLALHRACAIGNARPGNC
jgi:hypothetical protein